MSPRLFKYRSVNGYQGTDNHIWPIWKKRVDKKFKTYSYKAYLIVTWHRKLAWTQITVASQSSIKQSEKTANISRHHQWLPRNEGWGTTAEIPFWWCITTHTWVVLLILLWLRSDSWVWLKQISLAARPVRTTTQVCAVRGHQYGICALVPKTSFREEISVPASRNVAYFQRPRK